MKLIALTLLGRLIGQPVCLDVAPVSEAEAGSSHTVALIAACVLAAVLILFLVLRKKKR